jgi:hypothetical protein
VVPTGTTSRVLRCVDGESTALVARETKEEGTRPGRRRRRPASARRKTNVCAALANVLIGRFGEGPGTLFLLEPTRK